MSLSYIGQQIIIYAGLTLLIAGIIGNGINILIFSTVGNYRKTPCTFYFIVASITNIIYILFNFTTRLIGTINGIDFITISIIWCKIRQFLLMAVSLITLSCSCLSTIDQFFVTSQNVHIRRYSNMKWAHRIVMIIIIVWCLHAIPALFYFNISSTTNRCGAVNLVYAIFNRIYLLGLLCITPLTVMSIFGCLTYRNIRQTRVLFQQQAHRQLVRMTLFQVIFVIICFLPYGILSAYNLITETVVKDANQLLKESFVSTVVTIVTYFYYAGSCYMFLISSSRFRRATRNRLFCRPIPNQINPTQQ